MNEKPDLGLVFLIIILTALFAVFITVVDGLRLLSHNLVKKGAASFKRKSRRSRF